MGSTSELGDLGGGRAPSSRSIRKVTGRLMSQDKKKRNSFPLIASRVLGAVPSHNLGFCGCELREKIEFELGGGRDFEAEFSESRSREQCELGGVFAESTDWRRNVATSA